MALCNNWHYVSEEKLITIYHSIFSSHMIYGCQIWGLYVKSNHFKQIENLINQAVRIITFSRYEAPSDPIFKKLNILKLQDQISLFNCLLIHDHSRKQLPISFNDYFIPCTELHDFNTKHHSGSLFVPHVNSKKYGRNSIKLSAILKWNELVQILEKKYFLF